MLAGSWAVAPRNGWPGPAWAFPPGYPLPLWLAPGMPPTEIHRCILGEVGGEFDEKASINRRFTYDVVDHLERSHLAARQSGVPH